MPKHAAREIQELHDAYQKHDVRPIRGMCYQTKSPDGFIIRGRYGQCSCGRSFVWLHHNNTWTPLLWQHEAAHLGAFPEHAKELKKIFKGAI